MNILCEFIELELVNKEGVSQFETLVIAFYREIALVVYRRNIFFYRAIVLVFHVARLELEGQIVANRVLCDIRLDKAFWIC